ncbi:hypothetical protein J2S19_000111 [Metabacillus malikii]|uniref:Uncharacterized protein n=1 Tax=Metabacillus malikii TaxID=1504265 RepID=A0ABT9ZAJ5_9BACI|nr:hypothetical protein [Metabacillus malikii]
MLVLNFSKKILDTSFVKYSNGYPREDAWKLIKTPGKELSIKQDEKELPKNIKTLKEILLHTE